jgi:predicted transposase YdaD
MAHEFDKIFKEEAETLIKAIATKVLGISSFSHTQPVTASLQKTLERDPDWLRRVCHPDPKDDYIFHGEVHGKDEAIILDRDLVYYALLWHNHHLPVRQVVVYIGRKKKITHIKSELTLLNLSFKIEVINMHEVPYDLFIHSNVPEEVMLAILCDFKGKSAIEIVTQILKRVKHLNKSDLNLQKNLVQLEIISSLRNLQPLLTKILATMPITFDIRKDLRFKQGRQEGKQEGRQEGKQEGRQEEALIKDQTFVINLLQKGIESLETIAEFATVEMAFVVKTKAAYLMALPLLSKKNKSAQSVADQTGLMLEVVEKLKKNMG